MKPDIKELSGLILTEELRKEYLRNIELIDENLKLSDNCEIQEYRIKKLELEISNLKRLVLNLGFNKESLEFKEDKTSLQSMYC